MQSLDFDKYYEAPEAGCLNAADLVPGACGLKVTVNVKEFAQLDAPQRRN